MTPEVTMRSMPHLLLVWPHFETKVDEFASCLAFLTAHLMAIPLGRMMLQPKYRRLANKRLMASVAAGRVTPGLATRGLLMGGIAVICVAAAMDSYLLLASRHHAELPAVTLWLVGATALSGVVAAFVGVTGRPQFLMYREFRKWYVPPLPDPDAIRQRQRNATDGTHGKHEAPDEFA